ncbi:MAG: MerR family transcriptional regulator [Clostridiales bacterium]|nr:MerR family transcriptional regulator [Clostridiales bacterium]
MEYSIKQVSEMIGLSVFTIRYYDKEGLLPFVKRTSGGIRIFSEKDIEWLHLICCLKNVGMSMENIKEFMDLCISDYDTSEQKRELLLKQREQILSEIEDLKGSLSNLDFKIENYKEIGHFSPLDWTSEPEGD